MSHCIVSIEAIDGGYNYHLIDASMVRHKTFQVINTRTVKHFNEIDKVIDNPKKFVLYMKEKHNLHHNSITASYGQMLRDRLWEEKKLKFEENIRFNKKQLSFA